MSSSPTSREDVAVVSMPQMGISVAEGTLVEWTKNVGDQVQTDETVASVSTDKIDVEIPAPASGTIARILIGPGETVPVGTPLAEIWCGEGEYVPAENPPSASNGAAAAETPAAGEPAAPAPAEPAAAEPGPVADAPAPAEPAPAAETTGGNGGPEPQPAPDPVLPGVPQIDDRSGFYSPVVQRMAAEHNIDLSKVKGTGIGGRIRKTDLIRIIEAGGQQEEAQPEAAEKPADRPLHIESPYRPDPPAAPAAPAAAAASAEPAKPAAPASAPAAGGQSGDDSPHVAATLSEAFETGRRRESLTPMRRAIASHMVESRRTSAHCTTVIEVDMSAVAAKRAELKKAAVPQVPTYLSFVSVAVTEALREMPILNASLEDDTLVYHEDVNLGIAVSLDEGLIVPVIHKAQRLSLEGMAVAIADLAKRARAGKLEPDEVRGGTFTITNPGVFGTVLATPIINQPQVAILDLEAVVKRPVVIDTPVGDGIAIRPMVNLPMSFDHRVLDGADAARFLGLIKQRLENWE